MGKRRRDGGKWQIYSSGHKTADKIFRMVRGDVDFYKDVLLVPMIWNPILEEDVPDTEAVKMTDIQFLEWLDAMKRNERGRNGERAFRFSVTRYKDTPVIIIHDGYAWGYVEDFEDKDYIALDRDD